MPILHGHLLCFRNFLCFIFVENLNELQSNPSKHLNTSQYPYESTAGSLAHQQLDSQKFKSTVKKRSVALSDFLACYRKKHQALCIQYIDRIRGLCSQSVIQSIEKTETTLDHLQKWNKEDDELVLMLRWLQKNFFYQKKEQDPNFCSFLCRGDSMSDFDQQIISFFKKICQILRSIHSNTYRRLFRFSKKDIECIVITIKEKASLDNSNKTLKLENQKLHEKVEEKDSEISKNEMLIKKLRDQIKKQEIKIEEQEIKIKEQEIKIDALNFKVDQVMALLGPFLNKAQQEMPLYQGQGQCHFFSPMNMVSNQFPNQAQGEANNLNYQVTQN